MIVTFFEFLLYASYSAKSFYLLSHLNLMTTLRNKYYLKPYFAKKEIELPNVKS